MSWQIKGWLWLAAALIGATLVAGTSGAAPEPAVHTRAVQLPCASDLAMRQPESATAASEAWSCPHYG